MTDKLELDAALTHYGVLGMKWGHRKTAGASDIRAARRNVRDQRNAVDRARGEVFDTSRRDGKVTPAHTRANRKLDKLEADFKSNPNHAIAVRLTRGEKLTSVLLLGPLAVVPIAATSASSRRREQLLDKRNG